jgi:predicted PurR-regulated permease PerM
LSDRRSVGGIWSVVWCGITIYAVIHLWLVIFPFLVGFAVAYVLEPLVEIFTSLGWRRNRIVAVLYFFFVIALGVLIWTVVPLFIKQLNGIVQDLPDYLRQANVMIDQFNKAVGARIHMVTGHRLKSELFPYHLDQFLLGVVTSLPTRLLGVAHIGMWIVIVPFVSFYGLSEGRHWINTLFNVTPSTYVESLLGLLAEVNATLGGYIRGQLLDALCVGIVSTVGLWILGVKQFVLIGVVTGLLNPIPFLAPIVGALLALFLGHAHGLPASTLVAIVVLFLSIRLLDDFVFIPFIVGHSVQLHPALMLFSVLAGFEWGGLLGVLFAIPTAAVIKVAFSIALHQRQKNILTSINSVIS